LYVSLSGIKAMRLIHVTCFHVPEEHPEWHIQDDAFIVLYSEVWDLVIAHPPCTRLANSGVRWLKEKIYGMK